MSKTYKGWEILKMTEEGKFKAGDRIDNDITRYEFDGQTWIDIDYAPEVKISDFIGHNFKIIATTPVSFMEAFASLQKGQHIRVERHDEVKYFRGDYTEDYLFDERDISNGKWYIEK